MSKVTVGTPGALAGGWILGEGTLVGNGSAENPHIFNFGFEVAAAIIMTTKNTIPMVGHIIAVNGGGASLPTPYGWNGVFYLKYTWNSTGFTADAGNGFNNLLGYPGDRYVYLVLPK